MESAAPETGETGHSGESGDSAETGHSGDSGEQPPAVALYVNELMADNQSAWPDDTGARSDWVELYNAGSTSLDLGGYTLSDDWTDRALYTIPAGTTLEPGGFLVFWADGLPEAGERHMGFKLASDGEGVGVFDPEGEPVDWVVYGALAADTALARIPDGSESWSEVALGTPGETNAVVEVVELALVSSGDTWRYEDSGADLGEAWRAPSYDDSAWSSGPSPLGYGDAHATTVSYGPDSAAKHPTTYFRLSFAVDADALAGAVSATLELMVDDGALVWLNGEELARHNLNDGAIAWADYANATVSGTDETSWTATSFDPALLEAENVLAVEVHQASASSSDLQLDLALTLESVVAAD